MYNKQVWKDEIPDLTRPIMDSSGKQQTDPQTGRPLYELVQEGTRITSARLNHMEEGIEDAHALVEKLASEIGGNFVANIDGEMGLAFTVEGLSVSWTAGIAYVGGKRFEVPAGTMALNSTQGQYLYLDVDGVIKITTSQSTAAEALLLFYVATDASGVISTKDQRVNHSLNEILKKLDNIQIPIMDSVTSSETTKAASANAVKAAYDKAVAAETNAKTYIDNKPWQKKQMTADNGAAINISNEDLNNYRDTGFYMGNGLINAPDNNTVDWWYIEQIVHNGDYIIQHAYPLSNVSASNGMRQRRKVNGAWQPWSEDVFQSGVNAKQGMVDALNAKGITASTSDTWETLHTKMGSLIFFGDPSLRIGSKKFTISGTGSDWNHMGKARGPNAGIFGDVATNTPASLYKSKIYYVAADGNPTLLYEGALSTEVRESFEWEDTTPGAMVWWSYSNTYSPNGVYLYHYKQTGASSTDTTYIKIESGYYSSALTLYNNEIAIVYKISEMSTPVTYRVARYNKSGTLLSYKDFVLEGASYIYDNPCVALPGGKFFIFHRGNSGWTIFDVNGNFLSSGSGGDNFLATKITESNYSFRNNYFTGEDGKKYFFDTGSTLWNYDGDMF